MISNTGIDNLVRENIKRMKPYSTARHEFSGEASVFLDANENSYGSPIGNSYNRYPDPLHRKLKDRISAIKGIEPKNIFLGNGSDEAIDLLIRIFCTPGRDQILQLSPTYGMYAVCAAANDVGIKDIPLTEDFQPDLDSISQAIDEHTRMIFLCSPNNPSGNLMNRNAVEMVLNNFGGIVVVDEAYINYSRQRSWITSLNDYPNLVVLQTLSKAWGLAGLRVGIAFAAKEIIQYMNRIKYPYNLSSLVQEKAIDALNDLGRVNEWTRSTVNGRNWLMEKLQVIPSVINVYPSEANFILVKFENAAGMYEHLLSKGIIVRDRSRMIRCENCLRITVGTEKENELLVKTILNYKE